MLNVNQVELLIRQELYCEWLEALRELHLAEHELGELGPDDAAAQARWEAARARVQAVLARARRLGGMPLVQAVRVEAHVPSEVRAMDRMMAAWMLVWSLLVVAALLLGK